ACLLGGGLLQFDEGLADRASADPVGAQVVIQQANVVRPADPLPGLHKDGPTFSRLNRTPHLCDGVWNLAEACRHRLALAQELDVASLFEVVHDLLSSDELHTLLNTAHHDVNRISERYCVALFDCALHRPSLLLQECLIASQRPASEPDD